MNQRIRSLKKQHIEAMRRMDVVELRLQNSLLQVMRSAGVRSPASLLHSVMRAQLKRSRAGDKS